LKKILSTLILMFLSFSLLARVELLSPEESLNQGEIQKGVLRFAGDDLHLVNQVKLSDLLVDETLYIVHSGAMLRTEGASYLDIPVTFTFIKVPEKEILETPLETDVLRIEISGIDVKASEAADQFILEDFTIPVRKEWGVYFLLGFLSLVLVAGGIKALFYFRSKQAKKKRLLETKKGIVEASSYEEITRIWYERDQWLKVFPDSEEAFRKFESIYFQFAFKPSRSDEEIKRIRDAYSEFSNTLKGGDGGI